MWEYLQFWAAKALFDIILIVVCLLIVGGVMLFLNHGNKKGKFP